MEDQNLFGQRVAQDVNVSVCHIQQCESWWQKGEAWYPTQLMCSTFLTHMNVWKSSQHQNDMGLWRCGEGGKIVQLPLRQDDWASQLLQCGVHLNGHHASSCCILCHHCFHLFIFPKNCVMKTDSIFTVRIQECWKNCEPHMCLFLPKENICFSQKNVSNNSIETNKLSTLFGGWFSHWIPFETTTVKTVNVIQIWPLRSLKLTQHDNAGEENMMIWNKWPQDKKWK